MIMRKDDPMTFKTFAYYQYIPNCIIIIFFVNGAIIIKNNSLNM